MTITYLRKSTRSVADTAKQLTEGLTREGAAVAGTTPVLGGKGIVIHFSKIAWIDPILAEDPAVAGLIPGAAYVYEKDGAVFAGVLNPQLIAGSPKLDRGESAVEDMNRALRAVVNEAAGVGAPKLEKIKLYSTATCPYCRMEKEYLEKNKIPFELVMVDADRKAAEEMVQKTGQMGVPATEIIFDDGDAEIIVGFDKARLDDLLAIAPVR